MNDKAQGAPAPQDFDPTGLSADELKVLSGGEGNEEVEIEAEEGDDGVVLEGSEEGEAEGEEAQKPNPAADPDRKPKFVPHAALHQARRGFAIGAAWRRCGTKAPGPLTRVVPGTGTSSRWQEIICPRYAQR